MTHRGVALLLLSLVTPCLVSCASGSAIVTGTVRSPVPVKQVTLYLDPPADFEVIGLVSASSDAGWTEQGSLDYALHELREQAGRLGANGVLLVSSGERTTAIYGSSGALRYGIPVTAKALQGRAIFVKGR